MEQNIDIKENYIYQLDSNLLAILLLDKSSGKNIIWATDNYSDRGLGYQSGDEIMIDSITHRNGSVIKPRTTKSKKEQAIRVRDKAEVLPHPGYATAKIILLTAYGLAERKFSIPKADRHGLRQKTGSLFLKERHGRTM